MPLSLTRLQETQHGDMRWFSQQLLFGAQYEHQQSKLQCWVKHYATSQTPVRTEP